MRKFLAFLALILFPLSAAAQDAPRFIAGTTPSLRPDAPVITEFRPDPVWMAAALHGISEPYPDSVMGFLDDEGAWFTPFIHPGMTGPYDIRGWHRNGQP